MEALLCGFVVGFTWLSFLTHRNNQQRLEIKKLQKERKTYIAEILQLKTELYGKEHEEKSEEAKEKGFDTDEPD